MIFYHFWNKKCRMRVKFPDTSLISSAFPFALSERFLRRLLHNENNACTILCIVSRLRAALSAFRFILSYKKLQSSDQCILSIDQCLRITRPKYAASALRLDT